MRQTLVLVGLGLMAGAVLHGPLHAQVRDTIPKRKPGDTTIVIPVPPRADSLLRDSLAKRDSLARRDSIRKAFERGDTIRAPLAHSELPAELTIGRRLHWSRDSLAATGAITLADLLERVPGLTTLRAGWIASPANAAYLGDLHRVRVFYDGVSLEPLDPRGRGVLDLSLINLWGVEDAVIEQSAEEVRIYLRSWRVRVTTPYTRTDVATGDQRTNLYRGFFGERLRNGGAVQFGAQQYGTTAPVSESSSDQLGIVGRVGWAKNSWSVDAHVTRIGRHSGGIFGLHDDGTPGDSIPHLESTRTDAYVRVGYRDPDTSAVWWQAMAVASKYGYTGVRTITNPTNAGDSALAIAPLDTNILLSQYIATGGVVRGPLRLSAAGRMFGGGGTHIFTPSARASYTLNRLGVSAFVEAKGADSIARADVTAQFTPLPFVMLLGSVGRATDSRIKDSSFTANYVRAEAGLRIRNLWFIGGVLRRDSVRLSPPHVFDPVFVAAPEKMATGATAAIRGQVWRLLRADVSAVRWYDSSGYYRPQYQTRSELFARTSLLDRFPSGDLSLLGSVVHEYRSRTRYPTDAGGVAFVPGYRTISTLIEIRILTATISWQFRNVLGERYAQIPGFIMPRQTNYYGVRWEFSN